MELTDEQISEFDERGFLFLPEQFTREEVTPLLAEAERIYALDREEVWR